MDPFYYLCFVSYCIVCSLQPCGHLLGKDCHLDSLVCDVFLCFMSLPHIVVGSGVVLDCMDSWSLPSSLL